MGEVLKKAFKYVVMPAAILFGLYHLMAPGVQELDDEATYEPNSIQQEFMRLAAQKYDYLALGDTDHTRKEIALFAISPETVSAVYEGGDRHFFMESAPSRQDRIDALQSGESNFYDYASGSMWICSDDIKMRLNETFAESMRANPDMRYVAADYRHVGGSPLDNSTQVLILIGVPIVIYDAVYGCVDTPAFIPGAIIGSFTGLTDEFERVALDDRPTAEYIRSFEGGGTIFYGAGHFDNSEITENTHHMTTLFEEAGQSVTVINIYADEEHMRGSISEPAHADAYMYVTPTSENPDGIYINNPALQELYEQAKENVAARQGQPAAMQP